MKRVIACDNRFCLYWEEDACCLDRLALDVAGVCQACIYIELPPKLLDGLRVRQKARLEQRFTADDGPR